MSPVQAVMRRWWAFQPKLVPEGYVETYRVRGSIIDNVTHEGHPRVIFGSLDEPLTDSRCSSPLVPNPFHTKPGIADIRYIFPGEKRYTYLPEARKFFSLQSILTPTLSWRIRANEHEGVEKLQQSLEAEEQYYRAFELGKMREAGTIILVAQLNRRWIQLYGLGVRQEDAYRYQAICYAQA